MNNKEKVIDYARELEIDLIGFVKAEVFYELEDILRARERKNYLSGFEESSIEKRINPKLTLENAETIIVVGISYYVNEEDIGDISKPEFYGKISKSSWGRDYHNVLMEKIESLSEYMKDEVKDFEYKGFVDTGPLVDRHLAHMSGIGIYGKNNCIISKEYGSWIFLGYILCNLKIETDTLENKDCKGCNKCIDACPTGALMNNYKYNAKLCISYLTQTKEDIDYSLREKMGSSLYGCDVCQSVCQHNRDIPTKHRDFIPEDYIYKPNLLEILSLSNSQFKKRFGHSALSWRGNKIIKRNALIALGNSKEKKAVKHLVEYLDNPSIMIRKYTAWAIIRLDKENGKKILDEHLKKERELEVINEIKKLYSYYL